MLGGFQNNFLDHRQLPSKQLSESKVAIGKAGTSFLKRVTGIIFTINKEARRTLILDGLHQTIARDCAAHQRSYKIYWFDLLKSLKKPVHLLTPSLY